MITQNNPTDIVPSEKPASQVTIRTLREDERASSDEDGKRMADARSLTRQNTNASQDKPQDQGAERSRPPSRTSGSSSHSKSQKGTTTTAGPDAASKSKKRSSALFNFLTIKEPSKRALQEYEEQLKKQQGKGTVSPVGMSMVSSQKLPAHVPKTNSKWDGVPDSVKQRRKLQAPSSFSITGSAKYDDASSTYTSSTGAFPRSRRGSRLWDFGFGDGESSHPWRGQSRGSNYGQLPKHESSSSLARTSSSMTSLGLYRPISKDGVCARPNSHTSHRELIRSPSLNFKIPDLSESSSSSPAFRSPETPPPVPPSFIDDGCGSVFPNPSLRPKNSDGSLMQTRHEHVARSQPATAPGIHIQNSGPDVLPPPTPVSRRKLHTQASSEFGSSPGATSGESTPQSILKKRNARMPTPSPGGTHTPSHSPITRRTQTLSIRPTKPSNLSTDDLAGEEDAGAEDTTTVHTPAKGRKLRLKLNALRPGEKGS